METFCKEFTADPSTVREARAFVTAVLGTDHPFLDAAILVASELATNAVRYGDHTTYQVTVERDSCSAHLAVTNHGTSPLGEAAYSNDEAESGRGLALVRDFSTSWSVTQGADTVVRADFEAAIPVAA